MRAAPSLAAFDRAALAGDDLHHVAFGPDRRQVGRILHQPRHIGTHRQHAVRQARQQVHRPLRVARIQHLLAAVAAFSTVISSPGSKPPRSVSRHSASTCATSACSSCFACRVHHHQRRCLARNRVLRAAAPACPRSRTGIASSTRLQRAAQHPHRIAASLMNVHPGVSALQPDTFIRHAVARARRAKRNLAPRRRIHPARAADAQRALLFVVQIQEVLGLAALRREMPQPRSAPSLRPP